jgi:hypothetical protein
MILPGFAATGFTAYHRKAFAKDYLQSTANRNLPCRRRADNPADVVLHNSVNSADSYEFLECIAKAHRYAEAKSEAPA